MRRILALMLCACLVLTLPVGCAANLPAAGSTDAAAQTESSEIESRPPAPGLKTGYYEYDAYAAAYGQLTFTQAPLLARRDLPDVAQRLPENPIVYQPITDGGQYGGAISFPSLNIDQDWTLRQMNAGYLFQMNPEEGVDSANSPLEKEALPGILESWAFDETGKWFEFTIRKGLKWSDGVPVTTEDVRFYVEDILRNRELYPARPVWLTWRGYETKFCCIDDYTFRVEFGKPYGGFMLRELRVPNAYYGRIMVPAHYMKKYHTSYGNLTEILEDMKQYGYSSLDEWPAYYQKEKAAVYTPDYVGMPGGESYPTLDPWVVSRDLGDGSYEYERNPYFYMVDTQGRQLPYIDRLRRIYYSDADVMNLDIISGRLDTASVSLTIQDFPLYSDNQENGGYRALPLLAYQDHDLVFSFNMAAKDPVKRAVFNDLRFRQAVSLCLDRETMNEMMYFGLGTPSQLCPRPTSRYYTDDMAASYAAYDPQESRRLLDEMGMVDVDGDGFREAPDGSRFVIDMSWFVVSGSTEAGVAYLSRYLRDIGLRLRLHQVDLAYYWNQIYPRNEQEMVVWWLGGAGSVTLTGEFSSFLISSPLWWNWGKHHFGVVNPDQWIGWTAEPPLWAKDLMREYYALCATTNPEEAIEHARNLWGYQRDYLYNIGIVHSIKEPFIIKNNIGNAAEFEPVGVPAITILEQSHSWYVR